MSGSLPFGFSPGLSPSAAPPQPQSLDLAALLQVLGRSQGAAPPGGPAPFGAIWPWTNAVGTERLGEQSLTMPRGQFDPITPGSQPVGGPGIGYAARPLTVGERESLQRAQEDFANQAMTMEPGGGLKEPVMLASARVRPPGAPELPPPPAGAPGRLGSNADATLESLGLPAYRDVVPSTNTGPVPESMVRSGSPARASDVLDLSDTWRVPDVTQEDLSRIDPTAGRRKGLPQHIIDATTDPDIRAKMRSIAEAGLNVGGAYWYNAEPLRGAFVSELGPDAGNAAFTQYMRTVGAVSAGSDVGQNIRTASYYDVRARQGDPVTSVADLISPYGHKMQNTQFGAYQDIASGDPLDPQMRPKRASFDANLSGNQQPVTVDKHNLRLIGMLSQSPEFLNTKQTADVNYPSIGVNKGDSINWRDAVKSGQITMDQALEIPQAWKDVPDANHYAALEGFQQSLAREMGISPAQLQAALWVGGGRITGLRSLPTSFMGAFENRLQRTAAQRGGTPQEALMDFIRGNRPLLTPFGLAVGLGAGASALPTAGDGQ